MTSAPVQDDVYLLGGVIELALAFDRPVAVDTAGGTPSIELDIGGVRRRAHYIRGGGTRQLVFAYTVQAADRDLDGIDICGAGQLLGCTGAISPNGGTLKYRPGLGALLRHPSRLVRSPRVDGIGVCDRTPAVRDALVERLGAADCSRVTTDQLGTLTGTLSLQNSSIGTLKPHDFSDLTALQELRLQNNALAMLPEGVFSGLAALETLQLDNNSLTTLSVGIFSDLAALETLQLDNNSLTTLPAVIFSGLAALETLQLDNNGLTTLSAGIFSGLAALETLSLDNNGLTTLSAGIFSGLAALETLHLDNNGLTSLPAGVFRDLVSLVSLRLEDNPGSAAFLPIADAGADRSVDAGQVVPIRALVSDADPWDENVARAWTQTDNGAARVELTGAGTATISFVMPAGTIDLEFELRVTGRGGVQYFSTDTVVVVGAATTSVAVTSIPPRGDVYLRGEVIELTLTFDRPVAVDIAGGTPSIEIDVGGVQRRAFYVRGGGTGRLVFAYAVQATDSAADGIGICGAGQLPGCTGGISPNGGALEYRPGLGALLRHSSRLDQQSPGVDGIGICDRTPVVSGALVRRFRAADCSRGHD